MKFAYIKAEDDTVHKDVEFDDSATWGEAIKGVIAPLSGNSGEGVYIVVKQISDGIKKDDNNAKVANEEGLYIKDGVIQNRIDCMKEAPLGH